MMDPLTASILTMIRAEPGLVARDIQAKLRTSGDFRVEVVRHKLLDLLELGLVARTIDCHTHRWYPLDVEVGQRKRCDRCGAAKRISDMAVSSAGNILRICKSCRSIDQRRHAAKRKNAKAQYDLSEAQTFRREQAARERVRAAEALRIDAACSILREQTDAVRPAI